MHKPDEFWQSRLSHVPADSELPLFAEIGGEIVGLAWGKIERPDSHEAHLFHMWVTPEYRGRGVGRLLIDAVVAWAKSRGVRSLGLSVACGNVAARRLYESVEFRPVGEPEPMRPESELLEQPMKRELDQRAA